MQTLAGFEVDANDFHEKMELCDVCGSFLVIGDTQCRVDAHLLGKQHLGFARIRAAITELRVSKGGGFYRQNSQLVLMSNASVRITHTQSHSLAFCIS